MTKWQAGLRAVTAGALLPIFKNCSAGVSMGQFGAITADYVIHGLSDNTFAADQLPTCWRKRICCRNRAISVTSHQHPLAGCQFLSIC